MNLVEPHIVPRLIADLETYMEEENIGSLDEIRGMI